MLTTPQSAFLDLPPRRAGVVARAILSSLLTRHLPTLQRPEIATQRGRPESQAAVDYEQPRRRL